MIDILPSYYCNGTLASVLVLTSVSQSGQKTVKDSKVSHKWDWSIGLVQRGTMFSTLVLLAMNSFHPLIGREGCLRWNALCDRD